MTTLLFWEYILFNKKATTNTTFYLYAESEVRSFLNGGELSVSLGFGGWNWLAPSQTKHRLAVSVEACSRDQMEVKWKQHLDEVIYELKRCLMFE